MLLPIHKLKLGYTPQEVAQMTQAYYELEKWPDDHPGFLLKGERVPGIVLRPSMFDFEIFRKIENKYPFLEDRLSFINTSAESNGFKAHSDDQHCSVFCMLVSDNTTETRWLKIKKAPAFQFGHHLYGCQPHPDGEFEVYHREILQQGNTYLFDSNTFHTVVNRNENFRVTATWWLEKISFYNAYTYFTEHDFI
jgi:hypothetical protein